jgi:hypothetical protein
MTDQLSSALAARQVVWQRAEQLQHRLVGALPTGIFALVVVGVVVATVLAPEDDDGLPGTLMVGLALVGLGYAAYRTAVWPRTVAELGRIAVADRFPPLAPEEAAAQSVWRLEPQDARTLTDLDRILALSEPFERTPGERRAGIASTILTLVCLVTLLGASVLVLLSIFTPGPGLAGLGFAGLLLLGIASVELGLISAIADLPRVERAHAVRHAQWLLDTGAIADDGSPTTVIVRAAGRLVVDPNLLRAQFRPRPQHFQRIPGTVPPSAILELVLAWVLLGFALLVSLLGVAFG